MVKTSEKLKRIVSDILVLMTRLREWIEAIRFKPGWERGPVWAVGILVLGYAAYLGYNAQSGFGRPADILVHVGIAGIGYILLVKVLAVILRFLFRFPPIIWGMVLLCILAGGLVWGGRTWLHWFFNGVLVVCTAMLGTGIYFLLRHEWQAALARQKFIAILNLILGFLGLGLMGWFFFSPGMPAQTLPVQVILASPQIQAPDPSQPGDHSFQLLSYGSGSDLRRPEFVEQADLLTDPVNGSAYVNFRKDIPQGLPVFLQQTKLAEFLFAEFSERAREFYWGFGVDELPLNGRVWLPEGPGPFPLVLMVHGNHNMVDFSDTGYAYLGELLASRGFIFVSVDENFLNGGFWGNASGENDARAWLLLQHLQVWKEWNQDRSSPFYHKVDLANIGLIGHSRGGEAVALAATFSQLPRYPNNARISWDFDFNIRAVAAIAPVDEQWQPADHPNPLKDVNYLILQGSHDGDVYYFDGIQQYNRVAFSGADPGLFKAALYIYRANHSQYNSTWGTRDKPGIAGQFINQRALLTESDQQQIAKLYLSAFLEVTLKGREEYRAIFEDYRNAGIWIPQTGYISQYEDFGIRYVADFEEDIDVTTTSLVKGWIEAGGLSRWNELAARFRNNNRQDNHVVRAGWSSGSGFIALNLPENMEWDISMDSLLVFKAADARSPENVENGLDFSIVLVDRFDQHGKVLLSAVMPLQTQFPAEISRLPLWNDEYYKNSSEEVFQTYRIPLKDFINDNPNLDLANLRQIRFEFDQTSDGTVYMDEIGFDLVP